MQGAGAEPDRARLATSSSRSRAAAASARSTRRASANVWGIGVDADQSFLGPHILTSAQKGVDSAVFLTIKSIQDGSWKGGGNATFGLKEDGVGLGKVSPKVPQEDVDKVDEIKQQIADGEITGIPTEVGELSSRLSAAGDRGDDADRGDVRRRRGASRSCARSPST